MNTLKMIILSLSALILFSIPTEALAGPSDVRIRAKFRTPQVRVDVNLGTRYVTVRNNLLHRDQRSLRLSRLDRQIAKRLASYTGMSKHRLLKYRANGYRWSEIGRWLDLPRRVVRAARSAESWREFLRPHHRYGIRIR